MKRLAAAFAVLSLAAVAVLVARDDDEPEARPAERAADTRTCDAGSSVPAHRTTKRDAVLGPATFVAFRDLFENARADEVYSPKPGVEALKAALVFAGERALTIAVPPKLRGVLSLDYGGGPKPSVRFRSCALEGRVSGYPGGLLYTGRWPACVSLDVSLEGGRPTRHPLSFGAGRCKAPG